MEFSRRTGEEPNAPAGDDPEAKVRIALMAKIDDNLMMISKPLSEQIQNHLSEMDLNDRIEYVQPPEAKGNSGEGRPSN